MTRVRIPDDYDARDVPLPESGEFDNLRRGNYTGRVAQVRTDDDGRYIGVPEDYAPGVRDYLGVDAPDDQANDDAPSDGNAEGVESEDNAVDEPDDVPMPDDPDDVDGPTCAGTKSNGEECTRPVDEPGDYCFQHRPDDEETEANP